MNVLTFTCEQTAWSYAKEAVERQLGIVLYKDNGVFYVRVWDKA